VRLASLLKSIPKGIFWLAVGAGGLMVIGIVVEKIPPLLHTYVRLLFWLALAVLLVRLWTSSSYASTLVRATLLLLFSVILLAGAGAFLYWLASETVPVLIILLAAMVSLNFIFYPLLKAASDAEMDIDDLLRRMDLPQ